MTYADFITLMMIFFIVLYTLTPGVERQKFEAIIGAFQDDQGVLHHDSVVNEGQLDIQVKRNENWKQFQQYIRQEGLSKEVQVDLMSEGIRITLGESVAFDTYSARLKPKAKGILQKVGKNLTAYTAEELKKIEVQGHTDNRPVKEGAVLYKSNWELGAARAISVVRFLADKTHVNPEYLKASTYGPYRPRATNKTKAGRQRNRRVEIYIRYKNPGKENGAPAAEKTSTNQQKRQNHNT